MSEEIEKAKKNLNIAKLSGSQIIHISIGETLLSSLKTRDNEIKALEGLRMSLRDEVTELKSSLKKVQNVSSDYKELYEVEREEANRWMDKLEKEEQAHTMSVFDLNMKIAEMGIALQKEGETAENWEEAFRQSDKRATELVDAIGEWKVALEKEKERADKAEEDKNRVQEVGGDK